MFTGRTRGVAGDEDESGLFTSALTRFSLAISPLRAMPSMSRYQERPRQTIFFEIAIGHKGNGAG